MQGRDFSGHRIEIGYEGLFCRGGEFKSPLVLHRIHEGTPGQCCCDRCLELYTLMLC